MNPASKDTGTIIGGIIGIALVAAAYFYFQSAAQVPAQTPTIQDYSYAAVDSLAQTGSSADKIIPLHGVPASLPAATKPGPADFGKSDNFSSLD